MTLVSIQTVLMNVAMACSTQNSKTSSNHAKKQVSLGQRQINIKRNAIGPKRGQKAFNRLGTYFNLLIGVGALESCGTRE